MPPSPALLLCPTMLIPRKFAVSNTHTHTHTHIYTRWHKNEKLKSSCTNYEVLIFTSFTRTDKIYIAKASQKHNKLLLSYKKLTPWLLSGWPVSWYCTRQSRLHDSYINKSIEYASAWSAHPQCTAGMQYITETDAAATLAERRHFELLLL